MHVTPPTIKWVRVGADERGSVLVITLVVLSTLLVFAAYAIDEGIWFVHHAHLQTEADAAALAGAQNFQYPCLSTREEAIKKTVHEYDGTQYDGTTGGGYNGQVPVVPATSATYSGTQHNLISQINQPNFVNQLKPNDSGLTGSPCKDGAVDVKLSETNLPSFFPFASPKYITAQARVSIEQQTAVAGMEPLAVANTSPAAAIAYFVNEDQGDGVITESTLESVTGQEWTSAKAAAVAINKTNATTAHVGVVVALSGNAKYPKAAGTLATKCAEAFVQCFDTSGAGASSGPLLHIAGYSEAGTGKLSAPLARRVTLSRPASPEQACADGYFSDATATCNFAISAKIDYGAESTNAKGVTVTPVVAGKNSVTKLAYNAVSKEWTGTAALAAETGSNEVSLLVECKKETGSPCQSGNTKATIKDVQRIYAAGSEHSGPITAASVSEFGGQPDADSFEVCETQDGNSCTHNLAVTIDVPGSLGNAPNCATEAACKEAKAGFFDPLHKLKVEGNGGTIYECIPGENPSTAEYRAHLKEGCAYRYKLNEVTAEGLFSDPNCNAIEPYDCIAVGAKGNHNGAESGITERIESAPPAGTKFECPNNWQNNNGGKVPIIPAGDSRLVEVFVIPYGAINAAGEPTGGLSAAPIINFATFYVTGFPGDGCKNAAHPDDPVSSFEIVGHFIKYVSLSTTGTGSGECKETSLGTCLAILTK
jgi:hypothetical protein